MSRIYKYFLSIAVLAGFILWILWPTSPPDDEFVINHEKEGEEETTEVNASVKKTLMYVDVKGEVERPGVYHLNEGSRVEDAIEKAGGITSSGDPLSVNLAMRVQDEMVVIVLAKGGGTVSAEDGGNMSGKVFINQASLEDLKTLSGVGEAKAKAILKYREKNGPFQDVNDLLQVSGIGEKTLEGFLEDIQVP
ncbi:helix-hairpin-helix domain-containing protein [Pontibacillus sp. ALD_SL1]|uniref:helix-hairpin-helix domain-containing protein n=1 Tax=Pontibacillus sp. ALD_SL1 TaxID=2777185 RepID=UPI001A95C84F|nr:helix-hairpin-helix domain-containing protein [Pontibacillus sp. ALD_SL1]QSS99024.1 helix-hairpin-helix domain-containing protein [Pontibacillus sp. ALD_SL1]